MDNSTSACESAPDATMTSSWQPSCSTNYPLSSDTNDRLSYPDSSHLDDDKPDQQRDCDGRVETSFSLAGSVVTATDSQLADHPHHHSIPHEGGGGFAMREQDADLLESMRPNTTGLIPLLSSKTVTRSLSIPCSTAAVRDSIAHFSLPDPVSSIGLEDHEDQGPRSMNSSRDHSRTSSRLITDAELTLLESGAADVSFEMARRALSGDVWTPLPPPVEEVSSAVDASGGNPEDHELVTITENGHQRGTLNPRPKIHHGEKNLLMRRTHSMDRRMNEAAQFAEAVGMNQEDIVIIDHWDDDDDEDGDAKQVHVVRQEEDNMALNARILDENQSRRNVSENHLITSSNEVVKPIPHSRSFQVSRTKRGFLDKLPDQVAESDFVYKGIQSNPPEIVKRGTNRGNYALLHRKAWLEVSDKYHRYGKNLRMYYRHWEEIGCPTNMFFDWLDSKGEAAGRSLPELEECPRSVLDADTVRYITNPEITQKYTISFVPDEQGRGRVIGVNEAPVATGPDGWIFVLRDNLMYGAEKIATITGLSKQRFHHSSFFGGKAVAAAGILITDDEGFLTRLYPHSGHYRPGEAHMQRVLFFIHNAGVDLRSFEVDTQQIVYVARDKDLPQQQLPSFAGPDKAEKKKKVESLHLMPAVLVACFLAHKARFIGDGIFARIHRIRSADVTSVREALELIDDGGYWKRRKHP